MWLSPLLVGCLPGLCSVSCLSVSYRPVCVGCVLLLDTYGYLSICPRVGLSGCLYIYNLPDISITKPSTPQSVSLSLTLLRSCHFLTLSTLTLRITTPGPHQPLEH